MLSIRSEVAAFLRGLDRTVTRQMPFVVAKALTLTAGEMKGNTRRRMVRIFDRPTPYTLNGLFVSPATKRRPRAIVGFKDRQAKYLLLEERGGVRLPAGKALAVPVRARLNRYGSMSRTYIRRAIARPDTFTGQVRGHAGVWQRLPNGGLRMLVSFQKRTKYQPRLKFEDGAEKTATRRFPVIFDRVFAEAMA
jgi:hypothetical protein